MPTSGTRAGCTGSSAGGRCESSLRREASSSSRSTRRSRSSSGSSSASSSTSFPSGVRGGRDPVLAAPRPDARRIPPADGARPVRGARHGDHGAAGLACVGVRDPEPADRALRRTRGPRATPSRPPSGSPSPRSTSSSPSASRGARPST